MYKSSRFIIRSALKSNTDKKDCLLWFLKQNFVRFFCFGFLMSEGDTQIVVRIRNLILILRMLCSFLVYYCECYNIYFCICFRLSIFTNDKRGSCWGNIAIARNFQNCFFFVLGSEVGTLTSIEITGCESSEERCIIKRGDNATIKIDFAAGKLTVTYTRYIYRYVPIWCNYTYNR